MNELALFAGAGGGLLASRLLGWTTVGAVEIEEYPAQVLRQRQNDGMLEPFPIWDDIQTFDGRAWRGAVDVISGGFPCQDISTAGKGAGLAGERSGLWFHMLRIIEEIRPKFVFAENSPNLRTNGLGTIVQGLAAIGYDSRWITLGAGHFGAMHKRSRLWLAAHSDCDEQDRRSGSMQVGRVGSQANAKENIYQKRNQWSSGPPMGVLAYGVANRVDRLKALGNGQVPAVAATAFRILSEGLINQHQESDNHE